MADIEQKPAGRETPPPEIKPENLPTRRRKKTHELKIDKQAAVDFVVNSLNRDLLARQDRQNMRLDRYAKLRGYKEKKDWPYSNCANFSLPVMQIAEMRVKSTLENAAKSIRPMLNAKARQRRNAPKQERIDNLLDFQFFTENSGEKIIDDYTSNFVNDEAVFSMTHWIREKTAYRDIRVLPGLDPGKDHAAQLLSALPILFPTIEQQRGTVMKDKDGWEWDIEFIEQDTTRNAARVEFFERDDGKIEAHIAYTTMTFDGPITEILDWEDVVFPIRSANLNPPTASNPNGAPYVNRICRTSLDTIRRKMKDGTYSLLTEEDFEAIKEEKDDIGSGKMEEEAREQKDDMEGVTPNFAQGISENRKIVEHYGRWDADGDGLEEDVIFWVFPKSKKIAAALYLTEVYPGLPVLRPIHSESIFPIPNRIYGISLPELIEHLQDMMEMLLNQHIDWGTITNVPFFFYRAGSGLKPEIMRLEPGEGYPLDDPERDIKFPQFAQRDSSYTLNTMTLLQQFAERLLMQSAVQFGQVPAGKASALRTAGTTNSLIAQGDVRNEQILRRYFHGLAAAYQMRHRLNQRYMPEKKEIRIFGMAEKGEEPFTQVNREDQDAIVDFDFKATLLNTNKQILSEALNEAIAMTVSPLAIQAGIVTEREVYDLFRDKYKALDLDPDKYLQRPPNYGPKILAEEALSSIFVGERPVGQPLEPLEEHLSKLEEFELSYNVGILSPVYLSLYKFWKGSVEQQIMRKQLMMQAAAGINNGGAPEENKTSSQKPTGPETNPPVGPNEFIDESLSPQTTKQ